MIVEIRKFFLNFVYLNKYDLVQDFKNKTEKNIKMVIMFSENKTKQKNVLCFNCETLKNKPIRSETIFYFICYIILYLYVVYYFIFNFNL